MRMKSKKKIENIDMLMNIEYEWITAMFEDEYINDRKDMDTKTKLWLMNEIKSTYQVLTTLLVKEILPNDAIIKNVTKLINNLIFLLPVINDYIDLCDFIPKHYILILTYILEKAEAKEKFEICQNILNFQNEFIKQLNDKNIMII